MRILVLLVLLALGGCGQIHEQAPETKNIIELKESAWDPEPIFLTSQSASCEVPTNPENSQSQWIMNLFIGGRYQEAVKDLFDVLSGRHLKDGKIVAETLYDEESIIFTHGGLRYRRILKPGTEVNLCPGQESYPETSVENAALNVNYFVAKTSRRVRAAAPRLKLPPVKILISPKIKEIVSEEVRGSHLVRRVRYQTDNATYDPATASISFLPHSRMRNFPMRFWEIPVVASHEYGHHVFMKIFTKYPRRHKARIQCFGEALVSERSPRAVNWEVRQPTITLVLDALNEGFADLVAQYTLDEGETDLSGIPCLDTSRSVTSDVFLDGIKKTFSDAALESFFSHQTLGPSSCHTTDLQKVHNFGAIFAHAANGFLSNFTESKEIKLKTLIHWLRHFDARFSRMEQKNPRVFFREAFVNFLQFSVDKFERDFDEALCLQVEAMFPGISSNFSGCQSI